MADADVTAALQVIASEAEQVGCEETPARQGGTGHNGNSKVRSDRVTRGVMKF